MSNLKVKNADGDDVFLAKGGAGTDLDPHTEPAQAVTAASLPLPSGAATAANQTTIIGHVDGIETALATLDGRVDGVEALLTTVAGTVSGTEVQVDVLTVPANPFGANADAAVVAGAVGSMQAKLRLMTSQLDALITAINLVNVTHAGLIALNGAIAGTEVQVDVLTLPAVTGTVTVGSITAGNNNIGDVDVASLPALVAGSAVIGGTTDAGIAVTTVHTFTPSADATTPVAITPAPTSGQKTRLWDLLISVDTDMWIEIEEETSGDILLKGYFKADSGINQITPRGLIKCPVADRKMMVDAETAGNVAITAITSSES